MCEFVCILLAVPVCRSKGVCKGCGTGGRGASGMSGHCVYRWLVTPHLRLIMHYHVPSVGDYRMF